jgi:hypothetical protein
MLYCRQKKLYKKAKKRKDELPIRQPWPEAKVTHALHQQDNLGALNSQLIMHITVTDTELPSALIIMDLKPFATQKLSPTGFTENYENKKRSVFATKFNF